MIRQTAASDCVHTCLSNAIDGPCFGTRRKKLASQLTAGMAAACLSPRLLTILGPGSWILDHGRDVVFSRFRFDYVSDRRDRLRSASRRFAAVKGFFWYVRLNADGLRILVRTCNRRDMQLSCRNSARIGADKAVRPLMQDTMIVATATCPVDPAGGGRQWNSSLPCSRCSTADPHLLKNKLA